MIAKKLPLTNSPNASYAEKVITERHHKGGPLLLHPEKSPEIKIGRGGSRPGAGRKPKPPAAILRQGLRWCCVEAIHGYFDRAATSVKAMGFETYTPMQPVRQKVRTRPGEPEKFETVFRPKFYGYFFVLLDLDGYEWANIRPSQELGVTRLILTTGLRPAPVRAGLVEALLADEARNLQAPIRRGSVLPGGSYALIVRGPFAGQVAEVISCDGHTTNALISMMGGKVPVRIARLDVSTE